VYLVDLYHKQLFGTTATGVEFINYRYGPWSPDIGQSVEELIGKDIIEERTVTTRNGQEANIPALKGTTAVRLSRSVLEALDGVISDWGNKNTDEIVKYIKTTVPFCGTSFNNPIDFERCDPIQEYATLKGITVEQAATEDILLNKPLVDILKNASNSLQQGGHLYTYKEMFPSE